MTDVHIVHHNDGHIIPRMANWLADELGWSMSTRPRKNASVNYYMPYTALNPRLMPSTKTAAWFTHYEPTNRGKASLWNEAAKLVDLRCTTSPIYIAKLTTYGYKGPLGKLKPGIDVGLFEPLETKDDYGFLGFAGLGGDRKGIELARRLVDGGYYGFAAGKGWDGIPTKWFDYKDLPKFFNGINIFVCTSTIEGIPAPPLEALACGTRVVIPSGVGVMDELPEQPGIRHYDVGDFDSLRVALRRVVFDKQKTDPNELRQIILNRYSMGHWISSHAQVFSEIFE